MNDLGTDEMGFLYLLFHSSDAPDGIIRTVGFDYKGNLLKYANILEEKGYMQLNRTSKKAHVTPLGIEAVQLYASMLDL